MPPVASLAALWVSSSTDSTEPTAAGGEGRSTIWPVCAQGGRVEFAEPPPITTRELDMLPADNPFSAPSDLPYEVPPFDRIQEEHFLPAFTAGMAEQRAEVEAVASDPAAPTFENTLVALERSGRLLVRTSVVFYNLSSSHTSPGIQAVEAEVAPQLAAHRDAIFLDKRLYARVKALHDVRGELNLDPESAWLLERYHTDFVRAGAQLS